MRPIYVTKASGQTEPFSERKLARSLRHCGAKGRALRNTLQIIRRELYPGISTKDLYQLAFASLKSQARPIAARYSLKNAIFQLGPSGFPFERYVGSIFEAQGYEVTFNQTLPGRCIRHEIDVLAEKKEERILVECKYHNQPGKICDVKVALYVQARAIDLRERHENSEFHLVTNTRFSSDALQYAQCVHLPLLGWDYPENQGLKDLIHRLSLHPVTCLTTLSRPQKLELLAKGIVLSRALVDSPSLLKGLGMNEAQMTRVHSEVETLYRL